MPLQICSNPNCSKPVERNTGNCMICNQHLCLLHSTQEYHECPLEQDDADVYFEAYDKARAHHQDALIAKIDLAALQKAASRLRQNLSCTIPAFVEGATDISILTSQMGGQNLHVDVVFEDGVTWIARIRLDDPLLAPAKTRDTIVESEVATLTFLSGTKVPSPVVHHYTLSSSLDDVGVPYILMDKLKGSALDWQSLDAPARSQVLSQLADILIELRRYPFQQSGSLVLDHAKKLIVGSFAQTQLFKDPELSLGPFASTNDAATSIIEFYLEMYATGEMGDFPIESYLAFAHRRALADDVYPSSRQPLFFLKHFDDKGDHILVDEDANITGIIDWEYASTECEELAFSAPCMLWPVGDYYDGKNNMSTAELEFADLLEQKGAKELAEKVLNGRLHQRFWFFLGGGAAYDHQEFVSLFDGLRKAYSTRFAGNTDIEPYDEWRKAALEKCKRIDRRFQQVLDREVTAEVRG